MIRVLLALAVLASAPAAHAVVLVHAETGDVIPSRVAQRVRQELWLEDVAPQQDERLASFRIKVELTNASPESIRFAPPPPPPATAHPPVFPGVTFQDLGSDYNTLFVAAALPPGGHLDVTPPRFTP